MKKTLLLLLFSVISFQMTAQVPELITTSENGTPFGEIEIINNLLYRGGLAHEVAITDLSDSNFSTAIVATGNAMNPLASLRMTINTTQNEVFLSEFDSNIRGAIITQGTVTTLENIGDFELEVLGLDYYNEQLYITTTAPQILRLSPDDPENSIAVVFEPEDVFPIFNTTIQGDFLYYATQSSFNEPIEYQIFRLNLLENNPQTELVTTTPERGWTLSTIENFLYIGSDQNNTVYRKDLTDGNTDEASIFTALDIPNGNVFSITHDGSFLYYTQNEDTNGGSIFRIEDEVLSAESFKLEDTVLLYPNPTSKILTIQLSSYSEKTTYQIYDVLGREVLKGVITNFTSEISTQDLKNGTYILKTQNTAKLFIKI